MRKGSYQDSLLETGLAAWMSHPSWEAGKWGWTSVLPESWKVNSAVGQAQASLIVILNFQVHWVF